MSRIEYRQLRAPQEHGAALIDPALGALSASAPAARESTYDVQGVEIAALAKQARREALAAARRYTSRYLDLAEPTDDDPPIVMAGHQPNLFHAGVWLKNFVVDSVGRKWNAERINVLIDNDFVKSCSIRVPAGTADHPFIETVPFDDPSQGLPYEERPVANRELMTTFPKRVAETARHHLSDPLLGELWPMAQQAMTETPEPILGAILAQARHRLEHSMGLGTLEVPLSVLSDTSGFRRFACHLLAHLPRLWEIYNGSLADYRRVHNLRSRSHPVPDLQQTGDGWLEAPFWIWQEGSTRRSRAFVRVQGECLAVSDHAGLSFCLPLEAEKSADQAVEHLEKLRERGIKLRPRALITTMYFRLLLSDLFVHGIGGAKYDQLTDVLMRRFFGFAANPFLVVSGTFLLPLARSATTPEELLTLDRQLRDLDFNPQRSLDSGHPLRRAKEQLLTEATGRDRHRGLVRLNAQMQPLIQGVREQLSKRRAETLNELRSRSVLSSREFAFCLFPKQNLLPLLDILANST